MTPQSANLNLVNALQAQPGGKKQPDPASADTPFSKVLSNEMEQKKPVNEPKQASRTEARQAGKSGSGTAASDASATQDAASAETASQPTAETAASESQAAPAADSIALQPDAPLPGTELAPALPDALLALAAAPSMPIPAAPLAGGGVSAAADALAASTSVLPRLNTPAAPALTPAQLADAAAAATTAQQPVKADFQAAMTATPAHASAAAAVLPGQIAAALSPDALKLDETRPEGFSTLLTTGAQPAQTGTISAPPTAAGNALAPSVGSAAWGQALGEKIVWMTAGAQQTASLTLNPPNLGPLQVVINVNNDQATASFFAAQPEVRQALEAALPRLREMMNESGIQLGQATVSAEQQQQQFNEAANREARRTATPYPGAAGSGDTAVQSIPTQIRQSGRGLVDTFA